MKLPLPSLKTHISHFAKEVLMLLENAGAELGLVVKSAFRLVAVSSHPVLSPVLLSECCQCCCQCCSPSAVLPVLLSVLLPCYQCCCQCCYQCCD